MASRAPCWLALVGGLSACSLDFDDWSVAAMPTSATPCPLPRPPTTTDRALDRDGDCLDDVSEHAVARWYAPMFVFDSREQARRPAEPVILYQVTHPDGCDDDRIELTYGYLFRDDGGYVESDLCGDSHPGDNQYLRLSLRYDAVDGSVSLDSLWAWGFAWPRNVLRFADGHHPAIFLSAGKHHPYFDTRADGHGSPYSSWGCVEAVDGRGQMIVTTVEAPAAPGWANVGERSMHPLDAFVNDMGVFGYPGEDAWGTTPFCGGRPREGCSSDVNSMQALWR